MPDDTTSREAVSLEPVVTVLEHQAVKEACMHGLDGVGVQGDPGKDPLDVALGFDSPPI